MVYTIKLKTKFLGIFPYYRKIKNVKFHSFPTDFNNQSFLFLIKVDEEREIVNMNKYETVIFPSISFVNPENNPANISKEQQDILNKI